MKSINTSLQLPIPEGVTVSCKSRVVTVNGPRGTLVRDFKHVNVEINVVKNVIDLQIWFGIKKQNATLRTVFSHVSNMIKGVVYGFQYKMKSAYAHFPINVNVTGDKNVVEIRNFLGEKIVRRINLLEGVTAAQSNVKDEIVIAGNCLENVSQSAASIQQSTAVKNKDIRKFLDGIYVSERGTVVAMN